MRIIQLPAREISQFGSHGVDMERGEVHETRATTDLLVAIIETSTDRLLFREHEVLFGAPLD